MAKLPRVALFSDSFHELNGVGTVSREFVAFSRRREVPFCSVRGGPQTRVTAVGSVTTIELKRGFTFPLDTDLYCDPFLSRYRNRVMKQLEAFRPDLIQITGPGDMGILGFWISNLMGVPLAAAWHTNLHEYASRRVNRMMRAFPSAVSSRLAAAAERHSLGALIAYYHLAHFVLAPNRQMVDLLAERAGRPAYLMKHGVDTARFHPRNEVADRPFCIGWVGRLTPEKNVRWFAELERALWAAGERNFRLLLVGDGNEREWLRANLQSASLPGFLEGEELAAAFASMNAFVFPSRTDTFGLVVLEAMASGVPVVLSPEAGTRIGIEHGKEGLLCSDMSEAVLSLMRCDALCQSMSTAARKFAETREWDGVFEDMHTSYAAALGHPEVVRRTRVRTPFLSEHG